MTQLTHWYLLPIHSDHKSPAHVEASPRTHVGTPSRVFLDFSILSR
jgi:hypothetical protein